MPTPLEYSLMALSLLPFVLPDVRTVPNPESVVYFTKVYIPCVHTYCTGFLFSWFMVTYIVISYYVQLLYYYNRDVPMLLMWQELTLILFPMWEMCKSPDKPSLLLTSKY